MPRELSVLVQWVEDSETMSQTARELSERDRDYFDGKQLSEKVVKELRKRNQPEITTNIIQDKMLSMFGIERQQRNKPKALPRNQEIDQDASDAATDAMRFVTENNKYEDKRADVWENMVIEGFGGIEISIEFKTHPTQGERAEIVYKQIAWDRLGYDPSSAKSDFSDAKYKFEIIWMDLEDAKARWPDKSEELDLAMSDDSDSGTYQDKPEGNTWTDTTRQRVRIVKMYYHEGKQWFHATFTKGSMLKSGEVPFVTDDGESFCPLIMASGMIDRDNDRYGLIRKMVSPQDMINKFRSKATHSMSVNRFRVSPGSQAAENINTLKIEAAKPDGVLVADKEEIEELNNQALTNNNVVMLAEVKAELDDMGVNRSLQGKEGRDLSGRAERLRQSAGMLTMGKYLDSLRNLDISVYEMSWWMVRQFWTDERWVRITDDENNTEFVGLNKIKTIEDQIKENMGDVPPELAGDPRLQEPIIGPDGQPVLVNVPAETDVDIIVEQGINSANLAEEQFDELIKFAQVLPPELLAVPLLKASQIRGKEAIIDQIEGNNVDPKVAQEQAQKQQMAEQIQIEGAVAEIENTQADTVKTQSDAELNAAKTEETLSNVLLNEQEARQNVSVG